MEYDEYADEEWVEDEEGDPEDDVLTCPSCHKSVHEDTQQCPHCGDWIVPVWPRKRGKGMIWFIAAGLVILSFVLVKLWRLFR